MGTLSIPSRLEVICLAVPSAVWKLSSGKKVWDCELMQGSDGSKDSVGAGYLCP